jgi:hypothetical protein
MAVACFPLDPTRTQGNLTLPSTQDMNLPSSLATATAPSKSGPVGNTGEPNAPSKPSCVSRCGFCAIDASPAWARHLSSLVALIRDAIRNDDPDYRYADAENRDGQCKSDPIMTTTCALATVHKRRTRDWELLDDLASTRPTNNSSQSSLSKLRHTFPGLDWA